jgi:hypothetical protein
MSGSGTGTAAAPLRSSSVSEDEALRTCYAMLTLTTVVVIARVVVHVCKRRTVEAQDCFIYFAYVAFVGSCTLYVALLGPLRKVNGVGRGTVQPYPTVLDDLGYIARRLWSAQQIFYAGVFAVKLSLLCL